MQISNFKSKSHHEIQKHYFDFYWIPLDKGSEWISKIIEINPNTGQMSMNGNFKPRKLKIKGNFMS